MKAWRRGVVEKGKGKALKADELKCVKRHWRGAKRQCGEVKDDEEALKCDWCVNRCVKRH